MHTQLTWSVREKLRRPAESRTTDRGMVTRAVATHRTMSTAEGGLLSCIGVPAPSPHDQAHEQFVSSIASHSYQHSNSEHTCHQVASVCTYDKSQLKQKKPSDTCERVLLMLITFALQVTASILKYNVVINEPSFFHLLYHVLQVLSVP